MKNNLKEVIRKINPARATYEEWLKVGMAMKEEGLSAYDWDLWSKDDPRYQPGECFRKWETFEGDITPVTGGTIYEIARGQGAITDISDNDIALDWNDTINDDLIVVDPNWIEKIEIEEPSENWEGDKEFIRYLEKVFLPDEYVSYTFKSYKDDDGKFKPSGSKARKAKDIISEIKKYKSTGNDSESAIRSTLGDYNKEAGAWICFNPTDGKGRKDENIADFRYALLESDDMELGAQISMIHQLELPIKIMTFSGSKSIHALVKVNAIDKAEYRKRVNFIYEVCEKNGMTLDKQNRNPSRLSRVPGIYRGDKKQFIVEEESGKKDFTEWQKWIEAVNDDLGEPELPPSENVRPILAPELIEGILREGHKMLVAGPSKAGKSFLLLQLAIAFTQGSEWLGKKVKKSKVLYVNLELDGKSAWARIYDILEKMDKSYSDLEDRLEIWNLRGKAVPLDKLSSKLIRRAEKKNYGAIIIDPIYKVLTGDENNAQDMANFTNQFDKIATELDCAVIYCHHHSKGYQGSKRSMDRASGSGVFARDPDALIDMTELEVLEDEREKYGFKDDYATAWRIEGTLREFKTFKPIDIYFNYPLHEVDKKGQLKDLSPESDKPTWLRGSEKASAKRKNKAETEFDSFEMQYASYTSLENSQGMPIEVMANYLGITIRTLRRRIAEKEEYSNYIVDKSIIYDKEIYDNMQDYMQDLCNRTIEEKI